MESWREQLKFDPLPPLLGTNNQVISYFAKRELLQKELVPIEELWNSCGLEKLYLSRQRDNGSWEYHGAIKSLRSVESYNQFETYRILGELVEKYGLDKRHSSISLAAKYLFSFQTEEGDFRGI